MTEKHLNTINGSVYTKLVGSDANEPGLDAIRFNLKRVKVKELERAKNQTGSDLLLIWQVWY